MNISKHRSSKYSVPLLHYFTASPSLSLLPIDHLYNLSPLCTAFKAVYTCSYLNIDNSDCLIIIHFSLLLYIKWITYAAFYSHNFSIDSVKKYINFQENQIQFTTKLPLLYKIHQCLRYQFTDSSIPQKALCVRVVSQHMEVTGR